MGAGAGVSSYSGGGPLGRCPVAWRHPASDENAARTGRSMRAERRMGATQYDEFAVASRGVSGEEAFRAERGAFQE